MMTSSPDFTFMLVTIAIRLIVYGLRAFGDRARIDQKVKEKANNLPRILLVLRILFASSSVG